MKDIEIRFVKCVRIAEIALTVVGVVVLIVLILSNVRRAEVAISFYNLLIDIAVGVFTVLGLYWAASEFAKAQVKPDLRLVIGKESTDRQGIVPLTNADDTLIGRDDSYDGKPVSQITIGLFLENNEPKAAQYVRVTLRVRDVPSPEKFIPLKDSFPYEPKINVVQGEAVFLQFGEELVVYKGRDGVQLGNIRVAWPRGIHPERITLVAGLYSLEGEPKEVTISRPIHWI